ncbi:Hypp2003 [Branchiostoma lanceolatum]|uniref:Hypp2003 protein n=1 Tax=Branchiostoma lanceolatum TaxID=7740 RepID=A0A8J9ZQ82_BRALA|nr:Hypp2003 [Branchiostoma lanceolatum]
MTLWYLTRQHQMASHLSCGQQSSSGVYSSGQHKPVSPVPKMNKWMAIFLVSALLMLAAEAKSVGPGGPLSSPADEAAFSAGPFYLDGGEDVDGAVPKRTGRGTSEASFWKLLNLYRFHVLHIPPFLVLCFQLYFYHCSISTTKLHNIVISKYMSIFVCVFTAWRLLWLVPLASLHAASQLLQERDPPRDARQNVVIS